MVSVRSGSVTRAAVGRGYQDTFSLLRGTLKQRMVNLPPLCPVQKQILSGSGDDATVVIPDHCRDAVAVTPGTVDQIPSMYALAVTGGNRKSPVIALDRRDLKVSS